MKRLRKWLDDASRICAGVAAMATTVLKELVEAAIYRMQHLVTDRLRHWAEELLPASAILDLDEQQLGTRDLVKALLLEERATIYAVAMAITAACALVFSIRLIDS